MFFAQQPPFPKTHDYSKVIHNSCTHALSLGPPKTTEHTYAVSVLYAVYTNNNHIVSIALRPLFYFARTRNVQPITPLSQWATELATHKTPFATLYAVHTKHSAIGGKNVNVLNIDKNEVQCSHNFKYNNVC